MTEAIETVEYGGFHIQASRWGADILTVDFGENAETGKDWIYVQTIADDEKEMPEEKWISAAKAWIDVHGKRWRENAYGR